MSPKKKREKKEKRKKKKESKSAIRMRGKYRADIEEEMARERI